MPSLLGHVLVGHVTYAMSHALAGLTRDMGHEMKLQVDRHTDSDVST